MRLLDIAIFMSDAHIVLGRLHAIMSHQGCVAHGPVFALLLARVLDGCRQMIGAMVFGDAADLPQCFFDPFSQGFEGFAETEGDRFHIGVGEHKMMDHMGERNVGNGDAQILHVSKIRLPSFTRDVLLCKHHLAIGSMQRTPLLNMPL
jgi:hypothetical protein